MSAYIHERPSFNPESLAYGTIATENAATALRTEVDHFAETADAQVAVEIKTDPYGATSPVTVHDRNTEQYIGDFYKNTDVRVMGEEEATSWPDGKKPGLILHVDPIDGTELFVNHLHDLLHYYKLPHAARLARPICGAMVSVGAIRPDAATPEWGVIAAPFLSQHGIVRWSAGPNQSAERTEPDGRVRQLAPANTLPSPKDKGVVLTTSESSEGAFGESLRDAGFKVVKYKSAVATALSLMDPSLFEQLQPGVLDKNDVIVGAVMRNAKNWDVAATTAIANQLGHFVSNTQGQPRTFEEGNRSAIFALNEQTGQAIVAAIAEAVAAGR